MGPPRFSHVNAKKKSNGDEERLHRRRRKLNHVHGSVESSEALQHVHDIEGELPEQIIDPKFCGMDTSSVHRSRKVDVVLAGCDSIMEKAYLDVMTERSNNEFDNEQLVNK
ncbi:hypothetical protein ZWY2020_042070 [Hordeum vulgare]|nr:hypothetical protein ZWY2020_042070 [Hordeum vulgare]